MLTRTLPGLLPRRLFSVSAKMASTSPMEDLMRDKVRLYRDYSPTLEVSLTPYTVDRSLPLSLPLPSSSAMTPTSTRTTKQWRVSRRRRPISSASTPEVYETRTNYD